jgi:hypothetical protein
MPLLYKVAFHMDLLRSISQLERYNKNEKQGLNSLRKEPTLQLTCLLHTKILSPVKIKNQVCLFFIMIAEKSTPFISVRNQAFSSRTTFADY